MRFVFLFIAFSIFCFDAAAQRKPVTFPEKTTAGDNDAIYSQEDGADKKIKFSTARKYFLPLVNVIERDTAPPATGNTTLLGQFLTVTGSEDVYYVDGAGRSIRMGVAQPALDSALQLALVADSLYIILGVEPDPDTLCNIGGYCVTLPIGERTEAGFGLYEVGDTIHNDTTIMATEWSLMQMAEEIRSEIEDSSVVWRDTFTDLRAELTAIQDSLGNIPDGSGTAGYVAKWQDVNTVTNSLLYDSGTYVGLGTNLPGTQFTIRAPDLGTTQTNTSGLLVSTSGVAGSGATKYSGAVSWEGFGFGTTAGTSQSVRFRSDVRPVQGATPTGYLNFGASINGGAYSENILTLRSDGGVGIRRVAGVGVLNVQGFGTSAATKIFGAYNSSGTNTFSIHDNGRISFGSSGVMSMEAVGGQVNVEFATTANGVRFFNSFNRYVQGEKFYFTATGNGFGTTTPDYLLDVETASAPNAIARIYNTSTSTQNSQLYIRSAGTFATANSSIEFQNAAGTGVAIVGSTGTGYTNASFPAFTPDGTFFYGLNDFGAVAQNGRFAFQTGTGGSSVRMVITNPGLIGIGTTTPVLTLDVRSASANTTAVQSIANSTVITPLKTFATNTTPESAITASPGDVAFSNTGAAYLKESGSATNTGWAKFSTSTDLAGYLPLTLPANRTVNLAGYRVMFQDQTDFYPAFLVDATKVEIIGSATTNITMGAITDWIDIIAGDDIRLQAMDNVQLVADTTKVLGHFRTNNTVGIGDVTNGAAIGISGYAAGNIFTTITEGYAINLTPGGSLEVDTAQIATQSDLTAAVAAATWLKPEWESGPVDITTDDTLLVENTALDEFLKLSANSLHFEGGGEELLIKAGLISGSNLALNLTGDIAVTGAGSSLDFLGYGYFSYGTGIEFQAGTNAFFGGTDTLEFSFPTTNFETVVRVVPNTGGVGAEIRLHEALVNGLHYVSFEADPSMAGNIRYKLPAFIPASNGGTWISDAAGNITHRQEEVSTASGTTDGSGDLTVSHAIGDATYNLDITVKGTTAIYAQPHTYGSTDFKIRFFDMTGAPLTGVAVNADYIIVDR